MLDLVTKYRRRPYSNDPVTTIPEIPWTTVKSSVARFLIGLGLVLALPVVIGFLQRSECRSTSAKCQGVHVNFADP